MTKITTLFGLFFMTTSAFATNYIGTGWAANYDTIDLACAAAAQFAVSNVTTACYSAGNSTCTVISINVDSKSGEDESYATASGDVFTGTVADTCNVTAIASGD